MTNVTGTSGSDTFIGGKGNHIFNGQGGKDTIDYSSLGEAITLERAGIVNKGSSGEDQLINIETIIGAAGERNAIDGSTGTSGVTSFYVDLSQERLVVNDLPFDPPTNLTFTVQNFVDVTGTTLSDTLVGNDKDNSLKGGSGNDTLKGRGGDDEIWGENGDDLLKGGDGDDTLLGGNDEDEIFGEGGNDFIQGGNGDDTVFGSVGNDSIFGSPGNDRLSGDEGDDLINGDDGDDRIFGGIGEDTVSGNEGNDEIFAQAGNDIVSGGNGNDTLSGNEGDDFLKGGAGDDRLTGDAGKDTFVLARGEGTDTITDFELGTDVIGLSGGLTTNDLDFVGNNINLDGTTLASINISADSLIGSGSFSYV